MSSPAAGRNEPDAADRRGRCLRNSRDDSTAVARCEVERCRGRATDRAGVESKQSVSGQQNAVGIAIYEIDLMTPDQLDIPLDKQSPFHDWLRTAATFDLPGVGHEFDPDTDEIGIAGDLASTFSMPQR